jgi:hypothetical protein
MSSRKDNSRNRKSSHRLAFHMGFDRWNYSRALSIWYSNHSKYLFSVSLIFFRNLNVHRIFLQNRSFEHVPLRLKSVHRSNELNMSFWSYIHFHKSSKCLRFTKTRTEDVGVNKEWKAYTLPHPPLKYNVLIKKSCFNRIENRVENLKILIVQFFMGHSLHMINFIHIYLKWLIVTFETIDIRKMILFR